MIFKDQWKNEADKNADIWNMGYFVLMDESKKKDILRNSRIHK
jgi:hypothetical protein